MSSAHTILFSGKLFPTEVYSCSRSVADRLFQRLVLTTPGATRFTRIGANSIAMALVNPSIAAHMLAAMPQPFPGRGLAIPPIRLMEPPALMWEAAYFTVASAPQ